MALIDFINRIFTKDNNHSKELAKERLRLVLIHDRVTISSDLIKRMKEDILKVIRDYLDIEEDALIINFENEEDSVALIANIQIKGLKRAVST